MGATFFLTAVFLFPHLLLSFYYNSKNQAGCQERLTVITERRMGDVIHRSEIRITRDQGPTREAVIKGFDPPAYDRIYDGNKGFSQGVDPKEGHAATLDDFLVQWATD